MCFDDISYLEPTKLYKEHSGTVCTEGGNRILMGKNTFAVIHRKFSILSIVVIVTISFVVLAYYNCRH